VMASLFYRQPRLLAVAVLLIIAAGLNAFFAIPRLEDPILRRRVGIVTTPFPGATVEQVDLLVSRPLSTAVDQLTETETIEATSRAHASTLMVELSESVNDVEPAWSLVREQLRQARDDLPASCGDPTLEVLPIKACAAIVAIHTPNGEGLDPLTAAPFVTELQDRLRRLAGTESVEVFGGITPTIEVQLPVEQLIGTGLTLNAIAEQIEQATATSQSDAFKLDEGSRSLTFPAAVDTPTSLSELQIQLPSGGTVPLADLAVIKRTVGRNRSDVALMDQTSAIVLAINVEDGQRLDVWHPRFESLLTNFNKQLPETLVAETLFAQQPFVQSRLLYLTQNFLFAAIAVLAVTWVMMGGRSSVIVAAALPLSVLLSLFGLWILRIPIQQISVTGLVIALGLLIDNAIVVVEEFRRRSTDGETITNAMEGTIRHLGLPLFASTLTTTVAFLPIAMLPGPSGEFVSSMAISVILAINASLLVSLTLVPAGIAIWMNRSPQPVERSDGIQSHRLSRLFRTTVAQAYNRPLRALICVVPITVAGYMLLPELPKQFFPPSDRDQLVIEFELSADTPLEQTAAFAAQINKELAVFDEISEVAWFIGRSAPTFYYNVIPSRRQTPYYAQGWIDVATGVDPVAFSVALQKQLDASFQSARTLVRPLGQGPPVEAPIEIQLQGPEWSTLQQLSERLRLICSRVPGIIHTAAPLEKTISTINFKIDGPAAERLNTTPADIVNQLNALAHGVDAGAIIENVSTVPVRVVLSETERLDLQQLLEIPLLGNSIDTGSPVPVSQLVQAERTSAPEAFTRDNGLKSTSVKCYVAADKLAADVQKDLEERLLREGFQLPNGYSASFAGENTARSGAINDLMTHMVWLAGIAAATLLMAFRSFRLVLIIAAVAAIAFSICPLVLAATGLPLGFMAILGGMGLMGIAVNDAIVVVAALQASRADRDSRINAVVGCTRHVLSTTFTTIAGFLPLILYGGAFWQPLAITISCGIAVATLLSLYVVPSAYALLNPVAHKS